MILYRILIIDDDCEVHEAIKSCFHNSYNELERKLKMDIGLISSTSVNKDKIYKDFEKNVEFTSAFQGKEGIEMYNEALKNDQRFDLVICDIRMPPGINGKDTLSQIFNLDNAVMAIICIAYSDYSPKEFYSKNWNKINLGWIEKPFNREFLTESIILKLNIVEELKMKK